MRYEEYTNDKNRKDIKMIRINTIESNLRVTNAENTNEMYNGKIIRYADIKKNVFMP